MAHRYSFKEHALALHDRTWTVDEDVYLMENQDLPIEVQAEQLNLTMDEVSARRVRLGLIRRARAVSRMQ